MPNALEIVDVCNSVEGKGGELRFSLKFPASHEGGGKA